MCLAGHRPPPLLHVSHPRRRVLPFLSFLPLAPWTGPHFSLYFGTRKPSSLVHGRRPGIEPRRRPRIPPLPFLHLTVRNLPPGAMDLEPPPSQPPSSVSTVSDPFLANWFCPLTSPSPLRCCRCLPPPSPTTRARCRRGNATITVRTYHPTGAVPPW
jgi:hypothetical protein